MTNEQKQKIAESLKAHLEQKQISQNEFAKRNSKVISSANASNILTGKWESISDKLWRQVAIIIGAISTDWNLVPTVNFQKVQELCQMTQADSEMVAICGFTGAGKTTALRHFADRNPNVFYAHFDVSVAGKKEFLNKILEAMGLEVEGSISAKTSAIISKLNHTEKPLLILDQIDKVSDNNKLLIQAIYDATEFTAGIVLCGTHALRKHLDKMAAKDKVGFREFKSRISYWQPMYRPKIKAVTSVCKYNGIEQPECIRYITDNYCNYRQIRHIIKKSLAYAKRTGTDVSLELLQSIRSTEAEYENE